MGQLQACLGTLAPSPLRRFLDKAPQRTCSAARGPGGRASAEPQAPVSHQWASLTREGRPKAQETGLCGQLDHCVAEPWPWSSHLGNGDRNHCASLQG